MREPHSNSSRLVRIAVEQAASEPRYIAYVLVRYQQAYHVDDAALAAELGCNMTDLVRLALCQIPASGSANYTADLERIAASAGCDASRLAALLASAAFN